MANGRPGRPKGKPLTEAELERNRKAAGAARPRRPNEDELARINDAKSAMRKNSPEAAEFLLAVMRDHTLDVSDRIRAAESILDRGGVPRRSETDLTSDRMPMLVFAGVNPWPEQEAASDQG